MQPYTILALDSLIELFKYRESDDAVSLWGSQGVACKVNPGLPFSQICAHVQLAPGIVRGVPSPPTCNASASVVQRGLPSAVQRSAIKEKCSSSP